jgi:hypothetical protein
LTGYLTDYENTEYRLPELTGWEICHSWGLPADSFQITLAYRGDAASLLGSAVRFRGVYEGKTVFCGIVDEYELGFSGAETLITISGRGLGGLLVDNQCERAEYILCGINDVLSRYVYPLGIDTGECDSMPALTGYTVSSGTSCWNALEQFTRFAGGIIPRFSCDGRLVLTKGGTGRSIEINGENVTELRAGGRRYGVITEVLVKDADGRSQLITNSSPAIKGSIARRVISVPRKTAWDAMRYTGRYQIEKSQEDSFKAEVTLPVPFAAFPGDTVFLSILPEIDGEYFVRESISSAGENSAVTTLTLIKKEN